MSEASEKIRATVLERFTRTAVAPDQEKMFPVGPDSAKASGYNAREIDSLPSTVTESFCGVGNPLGLADFERDSAAPFDRTFFLSCGWNHLR
jgi:hypothetical protein